MASLKYPQCRPYSGMGKVHCLINAILDDYYRGRISADTAKSRLIYLIALNRVNKWGPENVVRSLVYEAISELPVYKGQRLKRSLERYLAVPA